ncbi:MAG: hypothetical protein F4Y02_05405 [Chloroflexi bacterium]|nr:hypothetical protein [Chloroflexota bacterium]
MARNIILERLENEAQTDLPEQAWKGHAFHHNAGDRVFTAVRAEDESTDSWAIRFVEPDASRFERQWTTEVAIRQTVGQDALFSLRTLVRSGELKLRIQPTVPKFLEHVSAECGLEQGIAKVETEPWVIESDFDAANLTEFLVDPDRRTPAIVLTVPEDAESPTKPLLDPIPLQRDTLGIAKLIVLPAEFTWKLTNRFGKRLSVYSGAMRVYLTGFSDDADPEGGHDLFMPHRMDTPETASRLESLLRWIAARESLRNMRLDKDVLPFSSVLIASVDLAMARIEEMGGSEAEQLAAAKQQLAFLRHELKLATQLERWLTEEKMAMVGRLRKAESKLRNAQSRSRGSGDRHTRERSRPRNLRPSHGNGEDPDTYGGGTYPEGGNSSPSGRWARGGRGRPADSAGRPDRSVRRPPLSRQTSQVR